MGPRLGRVEYCPKPATREQGASASMGPRLGRVEYVSRRDRTLTQIRASMGPRLGRVEYDKSQGWKAFKGGLQWGHA